MLALLGLATKGPRARHLYSIGHALVKPSLRTRSRFVSSAVGPKLVDVGVETVSPSGKSVPKGGALRAPPSGTDEARFDPKIIDGWTDCT